MWNLFARAPEQVTVALTPRCMSLCRIVRNKNSQPLVIKAYERIAFNNLEFEYGVINSMSVVRSHLIDFLQRNNLKNVNVHLSVAGKQVIERHVTISTSLAQKHHFITPRLKKCAWDYQYLGPSLYNGFDFYIYGIKREYLLQYKLLAIDKDKMIKTIATERIAQFNLYKYLYGTAFRQSQFALDLSMHNYDLGSFFTLDTIARIVAIDSSVQCDLSIEYSYITVHCGLVTRLHIV
jgi:hypothetical protein